MNELKDLINEPVKSYEIGSKERSSLQKRYDELASNKIEIPIIINGEKILTGDIGKCVMPHDHQYTLAKYHKANKDLALQAIESSLESWNEWSRTDLDF